MKKAAIFILLFSLLLATSCSSHENAKVNIIKGAGQANNSLMIGFNMLCSGRLEGFLGDSGAILASRQANGNRVFYSVGLKDKKERRLLEVPADSDYHVEISEDGSQFLYNNYLVNTSTGIYDTFAELKTDAAAVPAGFTHPPSYSFAGGNEALLTDPFYYIAKYYSPLKAAKTKNLLSVKYKTMLLNDRAAQPDLGNLGSIKVPDVSYIKDPCLLLNKLKYTFIGYKRNTGDTPLYLFDIYTRQFQLIDTGVKCYSISPDGMKIAYVKNTARSSSEDALFTADISGTAKKQLVTLPSISGITWSGGSSWIAYSGGEKPDSDIWIIKRDGTGQEQMTHGMYASGRIEWSGSGNLISFTSKPGGSNEQIYVIHLNLPPEEAAKNSGAADSSKEPAVRKVLQLLRDETALNCAKKSD